MTAIGIFGIYLSTIAFFFAPLERSQNRILMLFVAWVLHLLSAFVYYYYVQSHRADAWTYYNDPYNFYERGFLLGTWSVIFIVQSLKRLFGGSFLDYFLLFQAFGFWGVALLMRTIEEVYARFALRPPDYIFAVCWLPSLHFWTSSLGKDPLLFLACSLAVWSVMAPRRRWLALGASLGIMLLFRAHIALVAIFALAAATFLNKRKTAVQWFALFVLLACVLIAIPTVKRSVAVDVTSIQSVSDFLEARSAINQRIGGGAIAQAPYAVRVLSLLFRPLFFDAREIFGVISSMENLVMIFLVGKVAINWKISKEVASEVFAVRFWCLFIIGLVLLLSYLYYNVGLGLRQRGMFMPALLATFAMVLAVRKGRAAYSANRVAAGSAFQVRT